MGVLSLPIMQLHCFRFVFTQTLLRSRILLTVGPRSFSSRVFDPLQNPKYIRITPSILFCLDTEQMPTLRVLHGAPDSLHEQRQLLLGGDQE